MNGVDQMDQLRSTNPTKRKEMRLHMTVFTLCLDIAVNNAFCILKLIDPKRAKRLKNIREFKSEICSLMTMAHRTDRTRKRRHAAVIAATPPNRQQQVGEIDSLHMILPNKGRKGIHCHMCLMRGLKLKTIYGCIQCRRGYHPECFTAMHHSHALTGNPKILAELIVSGEKKGARWGKPSKFVSTIDEITFPTS